jgi:SmpA / OmlA family
MTPCRLLLIAIPVAAASIAVGAWLMWPRTVITPENAARIQPGMTVAEVEAILGGPARDEIPEQRRPLMIQSVRPDLEWNSHLVSVWVHLDREGRVRESRAVPVPPHGFFGTLRRWFGF